MRFVFSDKSNPTIIEGLCRWANPRIGAAYDPARCEGIAVFAEHGCAVVLYTDYEPHTDIRMHVAGEGSWLSRTALDVFFSYPFRDLGVRRVTALAAKRNARSRKLIEGVGFAIEGCARKAHPNGDNLIIYGMLRDECRWLKEREDGEVLATVAA